MTRILLICLILLTVIGCSTPTFGVGVTKEKALLELKKEPDAKHKVLEYELWVVKHKQFGDADRLDFYFLENNYIIYNCSCRRFEIDEAENLITDWINNTSQSNLREDMTDILNNKIRIGMRKMPVILSQDCPKDINETVGGYGKHEQWVYGDIAYSARLLYFENGILTSWQNIGK